MSGNTLDKILTIEELANQIEVFRKDRKKVVLCHGVFDLLHIGHVRHFQQAKEFGDILVVTITPDKYVNKGVNRPAFNEKLRAEFVAAITYVDYVAINKWPSAVETIQMIRPDVFVKGKEFQGLKDTLGNVSKEAEAVRAIGGRIEFTDDIVFSSSGLINQYLSPYPPETQQFLVNFASKYTIDDILEPLRKIQSLRVLLLGEVIIDEYTYCETIGKSGKEPILVGRYLGKDRFGGGIIACANHVASFVDHVDVLTQLGRDYDQIGFVKDSLKANVNAFFIERKKSCTIVKERFVEKYLSQKIFEVYRMGDEFYDLEADSLLKQKLMEILPNYDLVIVADYGHGMMTQSTIDIVCKHSRFLAVNTQTNAGNYGFNFISRYPRADYVCLNQREVALETRNQLMTPQEMTRYVSNKLSCRQVMITRGSYGMVLHTAPDAYVEMPALATKVVDRVGAGDAVLCLSSLCAAINCDPTVMSFIASLAAADAVSMVGNQKNVEKNSLIRQAESMLKMHAKYTQNHANGKFLKEIKENLHVSPKR